MSKNIASFYGQYYCTNLTSWQNGKTEYRAVIKFLVLEGQSSKQVEERLTSVYGQSSPSSSTIKRWVKEFQRGRESLEDDRTLDKREYLRIIFVNSA